jgi:hypothetical protein
MRLLTLAGTATRRCSSSRGLTARLPTIRALLPISRIRVISRFQTTTCVEAETAQRPAIHTAITFTARLMTAADAATPAASEALLPFLEQAPHLHRPERFEDVYEIGEVLGSGTYGGCLPLFGLFTCGGGGQVVQSFDRRRHAQVSAAATPPSQNTPPGTVRTCTHRATGEEYAVKVLPRRRNNVDRTAIIEREVRFWDQNGAPPAIALSSLHHPSRLLPPPARPPSPPHPHPTPNPQRP